MYVNSKDTTSHRLSPGAPSATKERNVLYS